MIINILNNVIVYYNINKFHSIVSFLVFIVPHVGMHLMLRCYAVTVLRCYVVMQVPHRHVYRYLMH